MANTVQLFGGMMPTAAMIAIGLAGVIKGVDLQAFATSLQEWTVVPGGWNVAIATAVVAAEVVLSASWFLRLGGSRRIAAAGVAFLVVVTGAYGLETILAEPPDCFCYGKILSFENHRAETAMLFGRNAVLVLLLLPGLWHRRPGLNREAGEP